MEAGTVAASSSGTLSAVGHSLASVGQTSAAFALSHPIIMATAGGALLGIGAYRIIGGKFNKRKLAKQEAALPSEAAAA